MARWPKIVHDKPFVSLLAIAVASLVVGMGISTVVFGLLNSVLFRPLPLSQPDDLGLIL